MVLFTLFLFEPFNLKWQQYEVLQIFGIILSIVGGMLLLLALAQLSENLSPFPTPKRDGNLVKSGLYKYSRHPIYTAILIITFGISVTTNSYWKIGICISLFVLFYFKSKYEEELLIAKFPEYEDYMKTVGRFMPK